MYFIFALIALFSWSGSDLFTKLGTDQKDKQSHWRVVFIVGVFMGLHAVLTIIISQFLPEIPLVFDEETGKMVEEPEWWRSIIYTDFKPIDFINYLPVAFIYIAAMVFGYVGLRYIELSVSSPICNSSGSLALVICILLGWAKIDLPTLVAVFLITVGIIYLGIVEYKEDENVKLLRQDKSNFKYTKSLIAILIPVIYLVLDALGTVGDQMVAELKLFDMSEFASNTSYEFAFVAFAIFAFIWVKFIKKEHFFTPLKEKPNKNGNGLNYHHYHIAAAACETVGQMFYMAVMFSDFDAGMPMISAYCAVSVLWSRLFLKEKLSFKHYLAIFITFVGILLLGIYSEI